MKFLVLLGLVGCVVAQGGKQDKFAGKYVFDLLKPPLSFSEVQAILASRDANQYPTYNTIPQTSFDCSSKAQPGFYADVDTQCQVFHRCEQSGNRTDYLCPNTTVFNQITLICDAFYNVDCSRSIELEDFANSRLYTNLPLFDTPPADYIAPYQQIVAGSGAVQTQQAPRRTGSMNIQSGSSQRGGRRPAAATTTTTHTSQSAGRSDDNSGSVDQSSAANGDQSSAASGDQQTGGQTGAMDQQGGAPAASGNAQSGGQGAGDQSGGSGAGQGAGDQSTTLSP